MAAHKAIRSKSSPQPQPRHAKRPSTQFKAQLFDTFQQLNRGYGIALSALELLRAKTRLEGPRIFPAGVAEIEPAYGLDVAAEIETPGVLTGAALRRFRLASEVRAAARWHRSWPRAAAISALR